MVKYIIIKSVILGLILGFFSVAFFVWDEQYES